MQIGRLLVVGAASMTMLLSGFSVAEEQRVSFDPVQLHEQARNLAAGSGGEYRERMELHERRQHRLMWDADAHEPDGEVSSNREQAQHRVQARRRLEARLNGGRSGHDDAAYGNAAQSRWRENRFGHGYEARMRGAQSAAAAGSGRSAGARR